MHQLISTKNCNEMIENQRVLPWERVGRNQSCKHERCQQAEHGVTTRVRVLIVLTQNIKHNKTTTFKQNDINKDFIYLDGCVLSLCILPHCIMGGILVRLAQDAS